MQVCIKKPRNSSEVIMFRHHVYADLDNSFAGNAPMGLCATLRTMPQTWPHPKMHATCGLFTCVILVNSASIYCMTQISLPHNTLVDILQHLQHGERFYLCLFNGFWYRKLPHGGTVYFVFRGIRILKEKSSKEKLIKMLLLLYP